MGIGTYKSVAEIGAGPEVARWFLVVGGASGTVAKTISAYDLIYAAFYDLQNKESFLKGVAQGVVKQRIEIDYIDLRGPAFETCYRRTLLAYLVAAGFPEAVFFPSKGTPVPLAEALYKKAVVLAPAYFGHVDAAHAQVHARLLASAIQ